MQIIRQIPSKLRNQNIRGLDSCFRSNDSAPDSSFIGLIGLAIVAARGFQAVAATELQGQHSRMGDERGSAKVGVGGTTGGGIKWQGAGERSMPDFGNRGYGYISSVDEKSDRNTPARVFGFWLVSFLLEETQAIKRAFSS